MLVSLFFCHEDVFLSAEHQKVVSAVCLFGCSLFCCGALVRACLGLLGSARSAWREGKPPRGDFFLAHSRTFAPACRRALRNVLPCRARGHVLRCKRYGFVRRKVTFGKVLCVSGLRRGDEKNGAARLGSGGKCVTLRLPAARCGGAEERE